MGISSAAENRLFDTGVIDKQAENVLASLAFLASLASQKK
jgi:hypothetical protein